MERVLLVLNAKKPSLPAIEFACSMAQPTNAMLTGLFIENSLVEHVPENHFSTLSYFNDTLIHTVEPDVITDTEQAIQLFKEVCQRKGIVSQAYNEKGDPIQDIIFESRFADLIVLDSTLHYNEYEEHMPSLFIKHVSAKAECPVLLIPEALEDIDEVVFCYDGSASAVFAIKQFTSLLPEFSNKAAVLVAIHHSDHETVDENDRRILDWLSTHYDAAHYRALTEDEVLNYFFKNPEKLVVMGAHVRRLLSNFFEERQSDLFAHPFELPLFMTHY